MQEIWIGTGERARVIELPDAEDEVLPGVRWGRPCSPSTPAYWAALCGAHDGTDEDRFVDPGDTLLEAVGFCLLGGFGIRYEVNLAAYERLRRHGAFQADIEMDEDAFRSLLVVPLDVEGRRIRYRFPNQRARRLALMRDQLAGAELDDLTALELRAELQRIEGVGPKTASWIVRNLAGSDDVAILDVHVLRACSAMALFPADVRLPRDYDGLERRFLAFARGIGVRPSLLDAVMWSEIRSA